MSTELRSETAERLPEKTASQFISEIDICSNGTFTKTGHYVSNPRDIPLKAKNGTRAVFAPTGFGNFVHFIDLASILNPRA